MDNAPSMIGVAQTYFTKVIIDQHGVTAGTPLRLLLDFLRQLYANVAPETFVGRLVVFCNLDVDGPAPLPDEPVEIANFTGISDLLSVPCVVQCLNGERIRIWRNNKTDPQSIAESAVVYSYEDQQEFFYAKSEAVVVESLTSEAVSRFAAPTFGSLTDALQFYAQAMIKSSSCPIFNEVWFDEKRLFLKNGPEHQMRNSLTHFLKIRLRGNFEVRPEQVVDSSHPVDIKVTWWLTNRLALIEIKWLGQSRDETKFRTRYTDGRAREGAKQLADYLDANRSQALTHQTRCYLVVIDARRAKLKKTSASISRADGLKYQFKELSYKPAHHRDRTDFHEPFRMFAEPKIG